MKESISLICNNYIEEIKELINNLSVDRISDAIELLEQTCNTGHNIYVAGNGGSAASVNHFVCDFEKNAGISDEKMTNVISLCDTVEKMSAYANDFSFEDVFSRQLLKHGKPSDLLIVVSASGNSPNIVRLCEKALEMNLNIISLSGFGGGKVVSYSNVPIIIFSNKYETVEDLQLLILHLFIFAIKNRHNIC